MTAKGESQLGLLWKITSPFIPFVIFLILQLFEVDFLTSLCIALLGVFAWFGILLYGVIRDFQRKRLEQLKVLTIGDATLNLWKTTANLRNDGSAIVTRKIVGVNLAVERSFYEFQSWTDPERDERYEEQLMTKRKLRCNVKVHRKEGTTQEVFLDEEIPPDIAMRANRVIHRIKLTNPSEGVGMLKPFDTFEIEMSGEVEPRTFKLNGDYLQHRVRHVTKKLILELILPKEWQFPEALASGEERAMGRIKSPTSGEWKKSTIFPEVMTENGRKKISWTIETPTAYPYRKLEEEKLHPKFLYLYRLEYCRLQVECLRCGHKWRPRQPVRPRVCPNCGAPNWYVLDV